MKQDGSALWQEPGGPHPVEGALLASESRSCCLPHGLTPPNLMNLSFDLGNFQEQRPHRACPARIL